MDMNHSPLSCVIQASLAFLSHAHAFFFFIQQSEQERMLTGLFLSMALFLVPFCITPSLNPTSLLAVTFNTVFSS